MYSVSNNLMFGYSVFVFMLPFSMGKCWSMFFFFYMLAFSPKITRRRSCHGPSDGVCDISCIAMNVSAYSTSKARYCDTVVLELSSNSWLIRKHGNLAVRLVISINSGKHDSHHHVLLAQWLHLTHLISSWLTCFTHCTACLTIINRSQNRDVNPNHPHY